MPGRRSRSGSCGDPATRSRRSHSEWPGRRAASCGCCGVLQPRCGRRRDAGGGRGPASSYWAETPPITPPDWRGSFLRLRRRWSDEARRATTRRGSQDHFRPPNPSPGEIRAMFGRGTPGAQPEYGSSGPDPEPWTSEARPSQTPAQRREELERWQAATVRVSVEALEPKSGSQFSLTAFWDPDSPPHTVVSSTGSDDRDARKGRRRLTTKVYPALTQHTELPVTDSPSGVSIRSVSGSISATDGRTTTDDAESSDNQDPLQEVWAEVEEVVEDRDIDDDVARAEVEAILRSSSLTTGEKKAVIEAVLDESAEDPQTRRATAASMLRRSSLSPREVTMLEEDAGGTPRASRASSRPRASSRLVQDGEELPRVSITRLSSSHDVGALEEVMNTSRASRASSRARGSSQLEQVEGEQERSVVIITRQNGSQELALLEDDSSNTPRASRAASRVRGSNVEGEEDLTRVSVPRPSSAPMRRQSETPQPAPRRRTFRRTITRDPEEDEHSRLSSRRQTPWPEAESRSSTRSSSAERGSSTSVSDNDSAAPRTTLRTSILDPTRPSLRRSTARTSSYMEEMPRTSQRRSTRSRSRLGTSGGLEGVAEEEGPEADERRPTSRQSHVEEDHPRDLQNEGYRRDDDDDLDGSCSGGCGRISSQRNSRLRGSVHFEASGPRSSQRSSQRGSSGGARDDAGAVDAARSGVADASEATRRATAGAPTQGATAQGTAAAGGRCRCTCGRGGGAVCRRPQDGSGGDPLDILCQCCREAVLVYTGRQAARNATPAGPQPPAAAHGAQPGCSCSGRRAAPSAPAAATGVSAPHRRSTSTPSSRGAAQRPPCHCCVAARNRNTGRSGQPRGATPAATTEDSRTRSPARPATVRAAGDDCRCCGKRAAQAAAARKKVVSRGVGGADSEPPSRAIWRWPRCLLVGAAWLASAILLLKMLWSLVTIRCHSTNTVASCWASRLYRATDMGRLRF